MPDEKTEETTSTTPVVRLTEGETWSRFAQKQIARLRHDWRQGDLKDWWAWFNHDQDEESLKMSIPEFWPIDRIGRTPLMASVLLNKKTHLKALVEWKSEADLNQKDSSGHAPLHYAAGLHFDEVAHQLLDAGAEERIRNPSHKTPGKLAYLTGNESLAEELGEKVDQMGIHAQTLTSSWIKPKNKKSFKKKSPEHALPWLIEEKPPQQLSEEDEETMGLFRDDAHLSPHQKGRSQRTKKTPHFVADFSAKDRPPAQLKKRVPYEGDLKASSDSKAVQNVPLVSWSAETGSTTSLAAIGQVAVVYKKKRSLQK
jgi:hypothetical protein